MVSSASAESIVNQRIVNFILGLFINAPILWYVCRVLDKQVLLFLIFHKAIPFPLSSNSCFSNSLFKEVFVFIISLEGFSRFEPSVQKNFQVFYILHVEEKVYYRKSFVAKRDHDITQNIFSVIQVNIANHSIFFKTSYFYNKYVAIFSFFCSSEKCFFPGLCALIVSGHGGVSYRYSEVSITFVQTPSIRYQLIKQRKQTKTITTNQKHKLSRREGTKQFNILKYFYSNSFLVVIESQYFLHTFQSAVTFNKRKNYCLIQQKNR